MLGWNRKVSQMRHFYILESLHHEFYKMLAKTEKHAKHKKVLYSLAEDELKHADRWKKMMEQNGCSNFSIPISAKLKLFSFKLMKRTLGASFATSYLEQDEDRALVKYIDTLKLHDLTKEERTELNKVIHDEQHSESELLAQIKDYEESNNYMRSIVFGLNDGLVELLAAVAGLAVVSNSALPVIVGGFIIGLSGTTSMAGGAYLSAKSENLVGEAQKKETSTNTPLKEGLYTGIYYFAGAIVPILPFIFGLSGVYGIISSIILVSIVLTIASIIIATISRSSVKHRIFEMLAISLGASFITIILGTIVRLYFGISI